MIAKSQHKGSRLLSDARTSVFREFHSLLGMLCILLHLAKLLVIYIYIYIYIYTYTYIYIYIHTHYAQA